MKVKLNKKGRAVLDNPLWNKGTAFTQAERDELELNGLLPPKISRVEDQIQRSYLHFSQKRTPLEKYESLIGLLSRNELLFYQFIARYPAEVLPVIYTPTVGDAAIQYSRIYFHQRGLYLSYPLKDQIDRIIQSYPQEEVDVIVVTDGERILGLGDLGIGGMAIPIGKLILYTLFGGIHPARTLPIILDVGTNNESLLNDDIQGTAAVTLAAILSALNATKKKLKEQKIVLFGGGSAGIGIADMLVSELIAEGLSLEEARAKIYVIDIDGLIHFSSKHVTEMQKPYIQSQARLKSWKIHSDHISLLDVIVNAHPTILIGVSAQGGAFNQQIIEEMARYTERPIILPLSNPTSKAECTPEQAIEWTRGHAIVATGSPFPPVEYQGKTYQISQCNNVYIFPGLGLGALGSGAKEITEGMFLEAARTLAKFSPAIKDPTASLFPSIEEARSVSHKIALAVAKKASDEGVATVSDIKKGIEAHIWDPKYPVYSKANSGI
jgi:malate dehydrogenase (oxaloacetate-decarboxylating)